MPVFNETKACEAIVRHLEGRERGSRSGVRYPEKEGHEGPVEMAFRLGGNLFALEHTGIEPFAGHVKLDAQAPFRVDPIIKAIAQSLDLRASLELLVPVDGLQNYKGRALSVVQDQIVSWVRSTAPSLGIGESIEGGRPSVPFPLTLVCLRSSRGPRFQIKHVVPEALRSERIRKACDDKFEKLDVWKRRGARSVLVLESNDIQLTNHVVVAETYLPISTTRPDKPDETYLVMTDHDHMWDIVPILIDDQTLFDLGDRGEPVRWEVDPASL